ncbi:3-hydroxyacyl-CoA dehydrogenase [Theobroma cacao]|nr:3-hydroxyacyl-CoA dehydrogenase [Theobroma cacao]
MAETKCLAVVGSGQMGSGIAQLGAMHGLHVWLLDTDPVALSRASKAISSSLQRFVSKGQLSQIGCELKQIQVRNPDKSLILNRAQIKVDNFSAALAFELKREEFLA